MRELTQNEKFLYIVKNGLDLLTDGIKRILVFHPEYTEEIYERVKKIKEEQNGNKRNGNTRVKRRP